MYLLYAKNLKWRGASCKPRCTQSRLQRPLEGNEDKVPYMWSVLNTPRLFCGGRRGRTNSVQHVALSGCHSADPPHESP